MNDYIITYEYNNILIDFYISSSGEEEALKKLYKILEEGIEIKIIKIVRRL